MFFIQHKQSYLIQTKTGGQPCSNTSPCEVNEYSLIYVYPAETDVKS